MKRILFIFLICICNDIYSQSIGIGTTNPNGKAVLDISSNSKGVLFPRLTSAQRDAISNPPNGLHVFNTDERNLNYYDSVYGFWNSYDPDNRTVVIIVKDDVCNLDFYNTYVSRKPSGKYLIYVPDTVTISGCLTGDIALNLTTIPFNAEIKIINHGVIQGAGGNGGHGTLTQSPTFPCPGYIGSAFSPNGHPGGAAIFTKSGVQVAITNYGIIGGGGGGGGTGAAVAFSTYGGGGGGGAGIIPGDGGDRGFHGVYSGICSKTYYSNAGSSGSNNSGGLGGLSTSGGGAGGSGGGRGQQGATGLGGGYIGGAGGKAIAGGAGNLIINLGSGQYFGIVD